MRVFSILNRMAAALSAAILSATMLVVIAAFALPDNNVSSNEYAELSASQKHTVRIHNMELSHRALDVEPGDTVVWINDDFVPHTITADDESWDSDVIEPKAEWEIAVVAGLRDTYFCRFHPSIKGRLNIAIE